MGESEKEYFNYKTKKCIKNCCDYVDCCSHECGHYTQIIWRETKVGCAVSKLGIKQIWVCQYNPPGKLYWRKDILIFFQSLYLEINYCTKAD